MERAPIALNRLGCTTLSERWSVDLRGYRFQLSFVCGYFVASFHNATGWWSRNCDTLPLSESSGRKWPADVGYTSANHPITLGSIVVAGQKERTPIAVNRLGCTTSKRWSVELRGYRFQLSFVCGYFAASFHNATGWSRNCDTPLTAIPLIEKISFSNANQITQIFRQRKLTPIR